MNADFKINTLNRIVKKYNPVFNNSGMVHKGNFSASFITAYVDSQTIKRLLSYAKRTGTNLMIASNFGMYIEISFYYSENEN